MGKRSSCPREYLGEIRNTLFLRTKERIPSPPSFLQSVGGLSNDLEIVRKPWARTSSRIGSDSSVNKFPACCLVKTVLRINSCSRRRQAAQKLAAFAIMSRDILWCHIRRYPGAFLAQVFRMFRGLLRNSPETLRKLGYKTPLCEKSLLRMSPKRSFVASSRPPAEISDASAPATKPATMITFILVAPKWVAKRTCFCHGPADTAGEVSIVSYSRKYQKILLVQLRGATIGP